MDDLLEYLENVFEDFDFRKLIFPTIMILLYVAGFVYLLTIINKKQTPIKQESIVNNTTIKEEIDDIYVDVKGSVKNPGVYKLKNDARVIDAIEASGGVLKTANTRYINLSKALKDGDVIIVYSNEEIENTKEKEVETIYVEKPCVCEEVKNDACLTDNNEKPNDKININTADINELKTLTGIGDAKAKAIIEYRTVKGKFKSIEDIKKVNGISESIFEKIKDNITV